MIARRPIRFLAREAFILARCVGKRVLHLGCLGETEAPSHDRVSSFLASSLHSRLLAAAREVIGIDNDQVALDKLRSLGVSGLYCGDVESLQDLLPPGERFDVVVAGDIIEHLSCPGLMLDCIRPFTDSVGELIITTPNAFGLPNYLRFLCGTFREGQDHVASYSLFTLENLLRRHGWSVVEAHTCHQDRAQEVVGSKKFRLGRSILARFPKLGGTLLVLSRHSTDARSPGSN